MKVIILGLQINCCCTILGTWLELQRLGPTANFGRAGPVLVRGGVYERDSVASIHDETGRRSRGFDTDVVVLSVVSIFWPSLCKFCLSFGPLTSGSSVDDERAELCVCAARGRGHACRAQARWRGALTRVSVRTARRGKSRNRCRRHVHVTLPSFIHCRSGSYYASMRSVMRRGKSCAVVALLGRACASVAGVAPDALCGRRSGARPDPGQASAARDLHSIPRIVRHCPSMKRHSVHSLASVEGATLEDRKAALATRSKYLDNET